MVETEDGPTMVLVEKSKYEKLLLRDKWLSAIETAGGTLHYLPLEHWESYDLAKEIFETNNS